MDLLNKFKKYKRSGSYYRDLRRMRLQSPSFKDNIMKPSSSAGFPSINPAGNNEELSLNFEGTPENFANVESASDDDEYEDVPDIENLKSFENLREDLRSWATEFNIRHVALNSLLRTLKKHKNIPVELPIDARTLLETPQKIAIVSIDDGKGMYWHQGLALCLENYLCDINQTMNISLNINIDGLPLYKGSKVQFWPILCNIFEIPFSKPMVVGIYYGVTKPKSVKDFLKPFIDELKSVINNGILVNGHQVCVRVRCFICDSPARAFLKGVAYFNSSNGCLKCTVVGEWSYDGHCMTFPRTDWPKRTDASFRLRVDIDHHQTDSPLEDLPINMIDDIIISDSLHLIDLGIVKRFLKGWTQGTFKNKRGKWSGSDMENINKFLLQCRMPKEIHRAVRGLDCLSHWKGLEYRTFFYYISIAVLKDNLPFELYEHFLLLYCAITICSSNVYHSALKVAKQMLNDFIEHYIENYGQGSITSNVHNLCHVVDEVEKFGNLTTLNAYPFENTLHHIKLLLRQGKNPLAQVARRIHELNKTNNFNQQQGSKFPILKNLNNIGFYRKVEIMDGLYLSDEMHNRWILTKNNEIVGMQGVKMIDNKLQISGCALKSLKNYFEAPIYSSYLNIYLSNCEAKCPPSIYYISDIKCKLVRLSCANNESLFIPLVHTLDLCNQN